MHWVILITTSVRRWNMCVRYSITEKKMKNHKVKESPRICLKCSYLDRSKAYSQQEVGNNWKLSGYKRSVREGIHLKKPYQAINTTRRLTNLFYCLLVLLFTVIYEYLTGYILTHRGVWCALYGEFKLIRHSLRRSKSSKTLMYGNIGSHGTTGYSTAQKSFGYRAFIVMEVLSKTNSVMVKGGQRKGTSCCKWYATSTTPHKNQLPVKKCSNKLNDVKTVITDKKGDSSLTTTTLNLNKLIHIIADLKKLAAVYESIKPKKANHNTTPAKETQEELTFDLIKELSKQLQAGKFEYRLCKNMLIPKISPHGSRPLTITPTCDQIVRKTLSNILNEVFEPAFLKYSHAYRPNKNCLSALNWVGKNFRSVKSVISANISNCLDNINHNKLLDLIKKKK